MNYNEPTYYRAERAAFRRIRIRGIRLIGLLIAVGAIVAMVGQLPSPSSSSTSPPASANASHADAHHAVLGEAGGAVPKGTTVFEESVPGVVKLDSDLLGALRLAASDAANSGVKLFVDSGWRSSDYQQKLLREAVAKYGSEAEASRWVAAPNKSAHVSGNAVDIGPPRAAAWLALHGAHYGLCQIYGNEPWHFELRADAITGACPAMYSDPSQDPTLR